MLLVIALAHAQVLSARQPDAGALDRAVVAVHTMFVDSRGYPMFAALFGYGLVRLAARRQRAGADGPAVHRLLRRRGGWMVLLGFFHTLLLFYGDIVAAYGLLSLVLLGALRRPDERLLALAGSWSVAGAVAFGLAALVLPDGSDATPLADPLLSAAVRGASWFVTTPLFAVMAAGPFLLGVWAARRGLLERPGQHLALLRRIAVFGIAIAVVGAVPLVVLNARPDRTASALVTATALHTLTGYAGGLGYAALIATLAARIGERRGIVVTALVACGQRSLSCYLAQSVAWLLLFEPYFADLGGRLGPLTAAGVGAAVWGLTVVLADMLGRLGRPGPAESLLRRLTYGPAPAS
jgi:uncharacterized membrane protein YeiB